MLKFNDQLQIEQFEVKIKCVQLEQRVLHRLAGNPGFTGGSGRGGHRALASSREEVQSPSTLTGANNRAAEGTSGFGCRASGLDPAGCLCFAATEMLAHQAGSSPPTATRPVARSDGQLSLSLRDKAAAAGYRPSSGWQSAVFVPKEGTPTLGASAPRADASDALRRFGEFLPDPPSPRAARCGLSPLHCL